MGIKIALLFLIVAIAVTAYLWIFSEFRWGKVITWIIGICAVIMPILLIDNYRLFVIAVLVTIVFEIRNLLQK
jgi:hypothetical protein